MITKIFQLFLYTPVKLMILMYDYGAMTDDGKLAFAALAALGED